MTQPQMTPEQALANLDAAASQAPLPRQQHVIAQMSSQVLAEFVKAHTEPVDDSPNAV